MRPPEFTGGNPVTCSGTRGVSICFNDAAGIHRRKRGTGSGQSSCFSLRFNEAAGIHRRKHGGHMVGLHLVTSASMRPPEFTGGNRRGRSPGGAEAPPGS